MVQTGTRSIRSGTCEARQPFGQGRPRCARGKAARARRAQPSFAAGRTDGDPGSGSRRLARGRHACGRFAQTPAGHRGQPWHRYHEAAHAGAGPRSHASARIRHLSMAVAQGSHVSGSIATTGRERAITAGFLLLNAVRKRMGSLDRPSAHWACAAVEKPLRHRLLGRSGNRRHGPARRVNESGVHFVYAGSHVLRL